MSSRPVLTLSRKVPVSVSTPAQASHKDTTPSHFLTRYETIISTLSPVHIGCGEDYEPTNYVIHDKELHYFGEATLASVLSDSDRKDLLTLIDSRNALSSIQSFIYKKRNKILATGKTRAIPIADSAARTYEQRIGNVAHAGNGAINQLEIERTSYHPHAQLPYLPGSSIKGAIRTALLNSELQKRADLHGRQFDKRQAKEVETDLLGGKFNTDPLRLIKVGDAHYQVKEGRSASQIRWQINKAKKQPRNGQETRASMQTLVECIPEKQGMNFRGQLSLQANLAHQNKQGESVSPSFEYDISALVNACNNYYLKEWQKERDIIDRLGLVNKNWLTWMDGMLAAEGSFGKLMAQNSGMLLRVGKHSGAESITLDDIAQIKIMGGRGRPDRYQSETTTLWLASEESNRGNSNGRLLPFGWIFIQLKAM